MPSGAASGAGPRVEGTHFPPALLYNAARLYYLEEATQAQVAATLGTSRATVSRLLSEARRHGIVRIDVVPPQTPDTGGLADEVAAVLGLDRVFLSGPFARPQEHPTGPALGSTLAPAVSRALAEVELAAGDVLLVSSGRTIYEVVRQDLAERPGVVVVPTIGGNDQPEDWYQTNEITRLLAGRLGGRSTYLFAPALPGQELNQTLRSDPAIQRVLHLWPQARCVLTGIGASPMLRSELPQFVPSDAGELRNAIGDICSRFFDRDGLPVEFPGSDRLIALDLETLRQVPVSIAVAAGADKVEPIVVAARAGYYNQLVTDPGTAEKILAYGEKTPRE